LVKNFIDSNVVDNEGDSGLFQDKIWEFACKNNKIRE